MRIYKVYFLFVSFYVVSCSNTSKQVNEKTILPKIVIDSGKSDTKNILQKNMQSCDTSYLEYVFNGYDLVTIQSMDSSIQVDLKYADTSNFLKRNLYDGLRNAYLPCEVATRLCNAQLYLKQLIPHYSLIVFDAARPLHIQKMMWDSLDMLPDLKYAYLSPPYAISLHNYGCAIDISIIDTKTNTLLDMGSEFDYFGKLSQPIYEWQFLKTGELSQAAYENRKLLRKVMQRANFFPITSEWWHFNYCNKLVAATKFKLIK